MEIAAETAGAGRVMHVRRAQMSKPVKCESSGSVYRRCTIAGARAKIVSIQQARMQASRCRRVAAICSSGRRIAESDVAGSNGAVRITSSESLPT